MREDASLKRDTPELIANVVYEAATDNKNQLHYLAGDLATEEYNWLKKEGIEKTMNEMNKRFF